MTPDDFLRFLARHNLTQAAFARIYGVTSRGVHLWLERESVPRTVCSFIRIFEQLPEEARLSEIVTAISGRAHRPDK